MMSRAGITAAVPIVKRRVRVARFLIVGGRCAARRLNIAVVPFFLVRASARMMDLPAAGRLAGVSRPACQFRPCGSPPRWSGGQASPDVEFAGGDAAEIWWAAERAGDDVVARGEPYRGVGRTVAVGLSGHDDVGDRGQADLVRPDGSQRVV